MPRPRSDFYKVAHPHPEDVLLIVEVSESTVRYDRRIKLPLYARHSIPEVWLIDIAHQQLSLFREPAEGHYQTVTSPARPGIVTPDQLPAAAVDLSGLFSA